MGIIADSKRVGVKILIFKNLEKNREELKRIFNNTSDLILYELNILCKNRGMVAYIESIVDRNGLYENLIKPLIQEGISSNNVLSIVPIAGAKEVNNIDKISQGMLNGDAALFIEGMEVGYLFEISKWEKRTINEPKNERVIRGPKEGFVEDINVNKSLIRHKIKNPNLVFEDYTLGVQTNTSISLVYMNNIVNPDILDEVRRRIKTISLSSILDSSYIEYYIEDAPRSLICTMGHTEKPDVASGKILEGRIAIICDGSPNVITIPKIFIENLQSSEDYYVRSQYGTYLRVIRLMALVIAIVLPGFVVALKTFHHEMIPTRLLMSMASGREGVPFTALIEGLLMIIFLELMKESSLRIPGNIGPAVTTISGLVLGQTAVQAGLVGPIMVIVVAATGISEFIIPEQKEMIVIYRFIILFIGGTLGLFGVVCGLTIMLVHLISLRSFGVPFMYPLAPYNKEGMKDFIYMRPLKEMNYRPRNISNKKENKRNEKDEKEK